MSSNDSNSQAAAKKGATRTTPYEEYMEELDAFQERHGFVGAVLIRGIKKRNTSDDDSDDDDDSDEEENDEDTSSFTREQMDYLRYVMVDEKRASKLEEMQEFVLGDQAGDTIMMFNTSFSYQIADGFMDVQRQFNNLKSWKGKFNLLFAYCSAIEEYDVWMHDNEGGMDGMVKNLAGLWKLLLKKSNEELGIDAEYTRPGIMVFLENFKKKVEAAYSEPPFVFKYT